jgi:hypothetical protein
MCQTMKLKGILTVDSNRGGEFPQIALGDRPSSASRSLVRVSSAEGALAVRSSG